MASGIFPRIAYDRDVFALGARGDVGGRGVGGHRDRVTGVQAVVVAIPADRFAQPVAAAGPQRQRGIAFLAVAHPRRGCLLQPLMLRHLVTSFPTS
jgi:hypothetical protein